MKFCGRGSTDHPWLKFVSEISFTSSDRSIKSEILSFRGPLKLSVESSDFLWVFLRKGMSIRRIIHGMFLLFADHTVERHAFPQNNPKKFRTSADDTDERYDFLRYNLQIVGTFHGFYWEKPCFSEV
jgi:hypothetical protein